MLSFWVKYVNNDIRQSKTRQGNSFFTYFINFTCVLLCRHIGFHHKRVSGILGNQKGLFGPLCWV